MHFVRDTAAKCSNIVVATAFADITWQKQAQAVDTAFAILTWPKPIQMPNQFTRQAEANANA
jgi:hypothetical protein